MYGTILLVESGGNPQPERWRSLRQAGFALHPVTGAEQIDGLRESAAPCAAIWKTSPSGSSGKYLYTKLTEAFPTLPWIFLLPDVKSLPEEASRALVLIEPVTAETLESAVRALRKTGQTARPARAEPFQALADEAPVMIWITDPQGQCTYLNRTWFEFTGQHPSEALGFGWLDAVHPEDRERSAQIFRNANLQRKPFRMEYRLRRKDQEWCWAIDSGSPLITTDKRFQGFIGSVIDITERKRAEEELARNEERLRLAVEGAGITTWDADVAPPGTVLWSSNATGLLGLPADTSPTPEVWMERVYPEDRERVLREWNEATGNRQAYRSEYRIIRGDDGRVRWIEAFGSKVAEGPHGAVRMLGICLDSTERKQAEDLARQSEERFRLLAEAVPQLVWSTRPDGACDYVNSRWLEYTGATLEEHTGEGWLQFLHPAERGYVSLLWSRSVAEGAPYHANYRIRRHDGVYRWFQSHGLPQIDADGRITRWLGGCMDIDEQKRTELALRESQERLHASLAASKTGTLRWEFDNDRLQLDENLVRLFGMSPPGSDGTRKQFLEMIHEEDRERVEAAVQHSAERGSSFDEDFRILRKDGSLQWLTCRGETHLDEDGRPCYMIGACVDVTDRKRAEAGLRESEERFRRLWEAGIIGIILIDQEQILESNDIFLEMLGYNREDLRQDKLRWPDLTPSYFAQRDEQAMAEILSDGRFEPFEKEFVRKDGVPVPVLIGATALQIHPLRALCFVLDLSEQKELQQKLIEADRLENIGVLAGGVAHDFNNLLVGILGNASLALEVLAPGNAVEGLLQEIVRAGERAAHLTRQMLAYAGRGQFLVGDVDLSRTASEMAQLLTASISHKVEIRLELTPELPKVKADEGQIQQVIMNLIINAAEAIGNGQGSVLIRTFAKPDVDPEGAPGSGAAVPSSVALEVSDNGCGMDEETRSRIFNPFFTTKFTGRGLGLAAVSGIVRSHGGTIEVRSEPGSGATFRVSFPATAEEGLGATAS